MKTRPIVMESILNDLFHVFRLEKCHNVRQVKILMMLTAAVVIILIMLIIMIIVINISRNAIPSVMISYLDTNFNSECAFKRQFVTEICSYVAHISCGYRWCITLPNTSSTLLDMETFVHIKHRKNCECCPGHYLIVNHYSSMSWFKFRNLSEMVNCVTNSLNHS